MRRLPARCAAMMAVALCMLATVLLRPGSARADAPPQLSVRTAALIEQSTGRRLFGVNPDERVPIASATKLMTALVTLEHVHRLGRTFTQNSYFPAPADSQIGLIPGERMSVHDLLIALMLPSADDAAEDLAFNVGHGSISRFIRMMNARARALHLTNTHYSTPIGLDTPGNYSSATDLVRLASYLLEKNPFFARVVALPRAVLHTGRRTRVVVNRNDLVAKYPWIKGVKTGHTHGAGYVLVAAAHRRGMTLLSAVLGTSSEASRDANTLSVLGYGFREFRLMTPVRAWSVLARPTVKDRPGVRADVIASASFTRVFARSPRVHLRVDVPRQLAGPLKFHAVVGQVVVLAGRRPVARVPLLLARSLPAVSSLTRAARFLTRPSTLLLLVALIGVVIALVAVWRTKLRGRDAGRPKAA